MAALLHRPRKADANQAAIVRALGHCGAYVVDLSAVGQGMADLLVTKAGRIPCLVEVKNPDGRNRYTPQQVEVFSQLNMEIYTFRSVDDVLKWYKGKLTPINSELNAYQAAKKSKTQHD